MLYSFCFQLHVYRYKEFVTLHKDKPPKQHHRIIFVTFETQTSEVGEAVLQ